MTVLFHIIGYLIGMTICLILLALFVGLLMAIIKSIKAASKIPVKPRVKQEPKPTFSGHQSANPDFVVLQRDDLLQFLGEVVLPPWPDGKGGWLGEGVNAAPIASQIVEWIKEHEITETDDSGVTL